MTSQRSTIKKSSAPRFPAFLGFTLKQSWTLILLFTIIVFFALPVYTMMMLSAESAAYETTTAYTLERIYKAILESLIPTIRYILVVLGCIFALVAVCKQFGYIKNKVATDFYHSLPLRRSQLYLSGLITAFCTVIIPFIINIFITFGILAANGAITTEIATGFLKNLVDVSVYSTFCLALTTIVSTVTGLTSVTLALTAEALAIVPASLAVFVGFFDIFAENMWTSYYLNENVFIRTSPLLRFSMDSSRLSLTEVSIILLISAVMLVGAYFIYLNRKSERAGTPVVFTPLGEVIKYINMVLVALFAGFIFNNIMDRSIPWTVFGLICGGVLTFMLMNTILTKNAKAMFKGIKGLAVYGTAMAVFVAVMIINPFGISSRIPEVYNISRVKVNCDQLEGLEFKDKETIEAIHAIYTKGNEQDLDYYGEYYSEFGASLKYVRSDDSAIFVGTNESMSIDVVFYPKFGLPVAKTLYIHDKYSLIEEFRTLLDSDEFGEQYARLAEEYASQPDTYVNLCVTNYNIGINNDYLWYDYSGTYLRLNSEKYVSSISADTQTRESLGIDDIIADAKNANFDYFQSMTYGTMSISGGNGGIFNDTVIPLRTDEKTAQSKLFKEGLLVSPISEQLDRFVECTDEIKLYNTSSALLESENGENLPYISVTDKDEIREILLASSNFPDSDNSNSAFVFNDREYYAVVEYDIVYGYDPKEALYLSNEDVTAFEEEGALIVEKHRAVLTFRYGMTPDFIADYFK